MPPNCIEAQTDINLNGKKKGGWITMSVKVKWFSPGSSVIGAVVICIPVAHLLIKHFNAFMVISGDYHVSKTPSY